MDRYDRQRLIKGWDQDRLTSTTLLIVGTTWTARFASLLAAAMGFGRIVLIGAGKVEETDRCFLLSGRLLKSSILRHWTSRLCLMNPNIDIIDCPEMIHTTHVTDINPDIVINADNTIQALQSTYRLIASRAKPVITAVAATTLGGYTTTGNLDMKRIKTQNEDPLVALVTAALTIETVRRKVMPLSEDGKPLEHPVYVGPKIWHHHTGSTPHRPFENEPARIAMIGAGALGTWAGIGLGFVSHPIDLTIYDPDAIEETNLNRQILYIGATGQPKAEVLAHQLSTCFPNIQAKGEVKTITKTNFEHTCAKDLILSGPDTFHTRAVIHKGALATQTPLINGGTSVHGANVAAYAPGLSPCLQCSLRIETAARNMAESEQRARCLQIPEASIVLSNAIAGALMAYEMRATLAGCPTRGVVEYNSYSPSNPLCIRSVQSLCHLCP